MILSAISHFFMVLNFLITIIIIIIIIIISEYFNRITLQCKSTVINGVMQHKSLKKKANIKHLKSKN